MFLSKKKMFLNKKPPPDYHTTTPSDVFPKQKETLVEVVLYRKTRVLAPAFH